MTRQSVVIVSLPFEAEYFRQVAMGLRAGRREETTHFRVIRWENSVALAQQVREVQRTGWEPCGVIAGMMSRQDLAAVRRCWRGPLVNVSSRVRLDGVASVVPDSLAVGRLACEHLLERGFRRLGFVGQSDVYYSRLRQRGFGDAAIQAGTPMHVHGWSTPRALRSWLAKQARPIGVLGCQDLMAFRVVDAAMRLGLRVPEDVAVLGVDNSAISCELAPVPVSSVDISGEHVGRLAVELIEGMRRGEAAPKDPILVPPARVVVRRSTSAWAVEPPELAEALRFIEARACDPISVQHLLDAVPIARRTLEREMSRQLGRSPHQQIRHIQLRRACRLLDDTHLKVPQVGKQCGFRNAKHFATAFRKRFGWSPQQYRQHAAGALEGHRLADRVRGVEPLPEP